MKTRWVGLIGIALLLGGCKSTKLQLLDAEGFPGWQQTRSSVTRPVPKLKVPTKAKQGVDDTVPADLTYRWAEGQTWDLTARETFLLRTGAARGVDGQVTHDEQAKEEVHGEEHMRFTVLSVDDAGTARIEQRVIQVRAEVQPPNGQSAEDVRVLDSESGETIGEAVADAELRRVEAPLVLIVESNGHVRGVEQADALRTVMLEGLEGDDRERVAAKLTDPELIGNAQNRFMILPAARVRPGKRWTVKVPASRPGKSLMKNIEVVSEYLGTLQVKGATCAKVYTRRVIPGERDEMGETKTLVSPVVLEQGYCLRLEDQRVIESDTTTLRLNSLVGTLEDVDGKQVQTTSASSWKVISEADYSFPPE